MDESGGTHRFRGDLQLRDVRGPGAVVTSLGEAGIGETRRSSAASVNGRKGIVCGWVEMLSYLCT